MIEIIHDPSPADAEASIAVLEHLIERVRAGEVHGYMIISVEEDDGEKTALVREAVSDLNAFDMLALNGLLVQAQAYVAEGLTGDGG
jgi:hypothetical protein